MLRGQQPAADGGRHGIVSVQEASWAQGRGELVPSSESMGEPSSWEDQKREGSQGLARDQRWGFAMLARTGWSPSPDLSGVGGMEEKALDWNADSYVLGLVP
ncbi:hypothetical protein AAY473_003618 [Plecturocebus cupreus]